MAPIARVCLTGPESTGKTHLAAKLAAHFSAVVVAEFARQHAIERRNRLTYDDVELIARGQMALDEVAGQSGRIVILDTDLISTVVYSRHYYGRCPEWIEKEARRRQASLYLLMDTDLVWRADDVRDAGGEQREELFDAFRRALEEFETNWVIVSGDEEERFRTALTHVSSRA